MASAKVAVDFRRVTQELNVSKAKNEELQARLDPALKIERESSVMHAIELKNVERQRDEFWKLCGHQD